MIYDISNYKEYLKSDYWKEIREQVYIRDDYKCRICNSEEDICVHHRTYEFVGDEKLEELITICSKCHYRFHKNNNLTFSQNKNIFETQKMYTEFSQFTKEHFKQIREIIDIIEQNNYILYSEFEKLILEFVDNSFNKFKYITYIMECGSLIHATHYNKNVIEKYNLPTKKSGKQKEIIIKKELNDLFPDDFRILHHTYSL